MMIIDRRVYQMVHLPSYVSWFIAAPAIVLLVPFLTHLLPAMVLYCWLAMPALGLLFACLALAAPLDTFRDDFDEWLFATCGCQTEVLVR
jgi:bacteriorhodopsin